MLPCNHRREGCFSNKGAWHRRRGPLLEQRPEVDQKKWCTVPMVKRVLRRPSIQSCVVFCGSHNPYVSIEVKINLKWIHFIFGSSVAPPYFRCSVSTCNLLVATCARQHQQRTCWSSKKVLLYSPEMSNKGRQTHMQGGFGGRRLWKIFSDFFHLLT